MSRLLRVEKWFDDWLEPSAAAPAAPPQRLYLWKPIALVVLGFFPAEEVSQANHTQRLFFGRTTPTVVGAPWYLWKAPLRVDAEEDIYRGANHTLLHRYRQSFQTVGQNYRQWPPPAKGDQSVEPEQRVEQNTLHRFRTRYQTVGQPFSLWPGPQKRIEADEYTIPPPVDLTEFRNSPPAVAQAGQPFFIWPRILAKVEAEEYTVPCPSLWPITRVTTTITQPGQPWWAWPSAKADQTLEPDAQRVDHLLLHRYRVGYQTVVQSWQYWIKPHPQREAEEYTVPGPASLYPFRQITVAPPVGQPWYMWPAAVADQSVEPNPVVTDHAGALYPFRPHDAITPPVPEAVTGAPGRYRYVIYINGRRHIGFEDEIRALIASMAEKDADAVIEGKKAPKRRIVVQPGKPFEHEKPDFVAMQIDFRKVYQEKLALAILENDDDEDWLLLL